MYPTQWGLNWKYLFYVKWPPSQCSPTNFLHFGTKLSKCCKLWYIEALYIALYLSEIIWSTGENSTKMCNNDSVFVARVDNGDWVVTKLSIGVVLKWTTTILIANYSGDLNTKLVWHSNGRKEVGCKMVRYLNTGQPDHLNTREMVAILNSYALVRYLNGQSSTKDIAHKSTNWIPNHLKSKYQKVWYSNVSDIQKVGIQIPNVVLF